MVCRIFLHKRSYVLLLLALFTLPTYGHAQQSVADFQMKCEAPSRAKGSPFTDDLFGIITSDGVSLFAQYYSKSHKQAAFKSLTGSYKQGKLVVKGKGYWIERNKSYPYFFSVEAGNFYDALRKGLTGYESTGDWKRKCTLRMVGEPLTVSNISSVNTRMDTMRSRMEGALKDRDQIKKNVEEKENQLKNSQLKLSETEKMLNDVKIAMNKAKERHEREIQKTVNAKIEKGGELEKLKEKLNLASTQITKTKQKLEDSQNIAVKRNVQIKTLQEKVAELTKTLVDVKNVAESAKVIELENKALKERLNSELSEKEKKALKEEKIKSQIIAETEINQNVVVVYDIEKLKEDLEFGDGFTNYSAPKNYRLVPLKMCIKNLTNLELRIEENERIFITIKGGNVIDSLSEATEAYNIQNNIDPLQGKLKPNSSLCGVLVYEVEMTKVGSIKEVGFEKNDEVIFKIGINK